MYEITEKKGKGIQLKRIICGSIFGILLTMCCLLLTAMCISRGILQQGREGVWAKIALFLGSFGAGWIALKRANEWKAGAEIICALSMMLFAIAVSLFTGISAPINMSMLWNLICIICGVLLAGVIRGSKRKKRRRNR